MDKHTHSCSKSHFWGWFMRAKAIWIKEDIKPSLNTWLKPLFCSKFDQDLYITFQNPVFSVGSNKSFSFHFFLFLVSTLHLDSTEWFWQWIQSKLLMQESEGHVTPTVWNKMNYSLKYVCKISQKTRYLFSSFLTAVDTFQNAGS